MPMHVPNPEFYDPAPPMVWHNLMETTKKKKKTHTHVSSYVHLCFFPLMFALFIALCQCIKTVYNMNTLF